MVQKAGGNPPSPSHGRRPDSSPFLARLGGADPGRGGPNARQATAGMEEATAAATGLLTPSRSPPSPSSRCRGEERLWWGWGPATATLGQDSARRGQGGARLGHDGVARRCRAARREGATVAWGSGGGGFEAGCGSGACGSAGGRLQHGGSGPALVDSSVEGSTTTDPVCGVLYGGGSGPLRRRGGSTTAVGSRSNVGPDVARR